MLLFNHGGLKLGDSRNGGVEYRLQLCDFKVALLNRSCLGGQDGTELLDGLAIQLALFFQGF